MKVSSINALCVVLFTALFSVATIGCNGSGEEGGGGEDSGGDGDNASAGGSSPEDVFAKFKKATENEDYKGAFNYLEESTQNSLAGSLVIGSAFMVMGDEDAAKKLEEVMKKHKLNDIDQSEMEKFNNDQKAATNFLASKINDKAQFFADVMSITMKTKNSEENPFKIKGDLKEVKTDGDKATGTFELEDGKTEPISFVKENGSWKIKMEM